MTVVIDSSYALACVMPDESSPATMQAVLGEILIAPFIWPVEIASALRNGVRRKRFDTTHAVTLAGHVADLDAKVTAPWHNEPARYLELSLAYELTPYDAIYLDLCLTQRAALATRDAALAAAASRLGIRTHT